MKRRINLIAAIVIIAAISSPTSAVMVMADGGMTVMWGANGDENSWNSWDAGTMVVDNGDGSFTVEDMWNIQDNCLVDFDLTYDPDPFINSGLAVTNNAAFTQTFMFTFSTLVNPPLAGPTLYGGSMSGSLTGDLTVGGTLSTVQNMPLYNGMIDSVSKLKFYDDPYSISVPGLGSDNIPAKNQPTTLVGPAVTTDIAIVYTFTLTPGEKATMNGFFEVVPEPATLVLLGMGGLLLRRRK